MSFTVYVRLYMYVDDVLCTSLNTTILCTYVCLSVCLSGSHRKCTWTSVLGFTGTSASKPLIPHLRWLCETTEPDLERCPLTIITEKVCSSRWSSSNLDLPYIFWNIYSGSGGVRQFPLLKNKEPILNMSVKVINHSLACIFPDISLWTSFKLVLCLRLLCFKGSFFLDIDMFRQCFILKKNMFKNIQQVVYA